eukprot:6015214-Prymnesium_polylepis.1
MAKTVWTVTRRTCHPSPTDFRLYLCAVLPVSYFSCAYSGAAAHQAPRPERAAIVVGTRQGCLGQFAAVLTPHLSSQQCKRDQAVEHIDLTHRGRGRGGCAHDGDPLALPL